MRPLMGGAAVDPRPYPARIQAQGAIGIGDRAIKGLTVLLRYNAIIVEIGAGTDCEGGHQLLGLERAAVDQGCAAPDPMARILGMHTDLSPLRIAQDSFGFGATGHQRRAEQQGHDW